MAGKVSAQERQWQAQQALRTLTEAASIQKDRKLMSAVKSEAKKQVQTLSRVAGPVRRPTAKKK